MMLQADPVGEGFDIDISTGELQRGHLTGEHLRIAAFLLHTRGYVILHGAVPPELAHEAGSEFQHIYRDCVATKQGDDWYQRGRETGAVFWERDCRWRIFPRLRPPFDSPWLLANPFVMELLDLLLGEGFFCKFVSSDTCTKGASLQSPHRELGVGRTWEPQAFVVNIPLGVCGLHNGPLEIWPGGSHLWNNDLLQKLDVKFDVQDGRNPDFERLASLFPSRKVELAPGDVLIRDPGMMHRGTVNESDDPRSMLTTCYFRRGHAHDYGKCDYNLDRELWEGLDPAVKALFAYAFEPGLNGVPSDTANGSSSVAASVEPGVSPLWRD
jgi:ectoine hydroxylase-related dioxygenase (phytanoyl-CoA dioxygenase family)